jgi:predicted permease
LIVAKISRVTLNEAVALPIVVSWLVMASLVAIVLVMGKAFSWDRTIVGALLLVGVLGNTSFLGLGMVESLLGADHLASAIAYDQIGTFVGLSLWGSFVASTYGDGARGWKPIVQRLVRFGPFIALLLCIPLRWIQLPSQGYDVLQLFGKTVAPVAMGAFGLRFSLRLSRNVLAPALIGLVCKMALLPVIVYVVAFVVASPTDIAWSASVLQSAAPPMVTAGVVAVSAGFSEDLVAFMVGAGTLIAFVSLPLLSLAL